jgi:hypothetical protein
MMVGHDDGSASLCSLQLLFSNSSEFVGAIMIGSRTVSSSSNETLRQNNVDGDDSIIII